MKKIILFSTISVLLSACGGSGRDNNFANEPKPVVSSVKLSTGQTIQLKGTGVITSVDPNTTVNADTAGTVLNNAIQGRTYAGGYATDSSYAFTETNRTGYTSMPQFGGNETADIPVSGTANYAGEVYGLGRYTNSNGWETLSAGRPVNDGVVAGDARLAVDFGSKQITEAYFGNLNTWNGKKTEKISTNSSNGTEEKEIVYTSSEYIAYVLDAPASFADVKAGKAVVNTILTERNTKDGVTEADKQTLGGPGKLTANFYGAGAKEVAGKIIMDNLSDQESNAAFHARKQ